MATEGGQMHKPIVVLLTLMLTQSGCSLFGGYTDEIYRPFPPRDGEARS